MFCETIEYFYPIESATYQRVYIFIWWHYWLLL